MCSMLDVLWAQIVEVHNEAKTLFLLGEELEHEHFRDFIQPINEHRHSLEHIVRAKANSLGLDPDGANETYQHDSLRKALGHEYRAFFDCADWIAIILREDIENTLRPYDADSIKDALPDYYSRLRGRVTEISIAIAQKRGDKNVSKADKILNDVREYKVILDELRGLHKRVTTAQDALEDHRSRTRKTRVNKWILGIAGSLVVAGIVGVVGFCWGKAVGTTSPAASPSQHHESSGK